MKTLQWLPFLLAIGMMACLPPKRQVEFETRLNRWVGQPMSAFIKANPFPAETSPRRPDGGRSYVFASTDSQPISFNYTEYTNYATGQRVVQGAAAHPPDWMNDGGAQQVRVADRSFEGKANFYCRVILETDANEMIRAVRYEGNKCW